MRELGECRNQAEGGTGLESGFVLFAEDREIAFCFRDRQPRPWMVRKTGPRNRIEAEYLQQKKAREILGERVPEILAFDASGELAVLAVKYVPEKFLSNVVAGRFFRREKVFGREALKLFAFFEEVFLAIHSASAPRTRRLDDRVLGQWEEKLESLDGEKSRGVLAALADLKGAELPVLFQHGDFCPRNILYAEGGRKVLIDWEDAGDDHFALTDFALLIFSLKDFHSSVFGDPVPVKSELSNVPATLAERLRELLRLERDLFDKLFLASLVSLCCQSIGKGRAGTAHGILNAINSQIRTGKIL